MNLDKIAEDIAENLEKMAELIDPSMHKVAGSNVDELDSEHTLNFLKFFSTPTLE